MWKASFDNRWLAVLTFSVGKKNPLIVCLASGRVQDDSVVYLIKEYEQQQT